MKNIVFRVDASPAIGVGHVMRCLTLAIELSFSFRIHFVCNQDLPADLESEILRAGFACSKAGVASFAAFGTYEDADRTIREIEHKATWLIVDHYRIDSKWETALRPYAERILVIDDLANRDHQCDALLDQNLYRSADKRYEGLVPEKTRLFLGPAYMLLRPRFFSNKIFETKKEIHDVLVNFGGTDPTGEIVKLLEALETNRSDFSKVKFHVVAGLANPKREEIEAACSRIEYTVYYEQAVMEELLPKMDLALGAGGITMWERCFMGVPSGVIITADNQIEAVTEAARRGLIWNLGEQQTVTPEMIRRFWETRLIQPHENEEMSRRCLAFMKPLRERKENPVVTMIKEEL